MGGGTTDLACGALVNAAARAHQGFALRRDGVDDDFLDAAVRLQLRQDKSDANTVPMLERVALRGETDQWQQWARSELAKRASGRDSSEAE